MRISVEAVVRAVTSGETVSDAPSVAVTVQRYSDNIGRPNTLAVVPSTAIRVSGTSIFAAAMQDSLTSSRKKRLPVAAGAKSSAEKQIFEFAVPPVRGTERFVSPVLDIPVMVLNSFV
jgi:hypothetical protein